MSDFSARRSAGLDLVRSIAILCVVVSHYWPLYERFPAAGPLKFFGILGVEIFFVLSGFLIGGILLRQAADLSEQAGGFKLSDAPGFWIRRWFRTLPNYLLFFVAYLVFDQPWTKDHWGSWAMSVLFLQNLVTDLSDGTYGVAWSLCVEEWLYLLLPLLLAVFTMRVRHPGKAALGAAATLIVVPTLLRCTTLGKEWDLGVRHVVIYRLDAIAYGVLLAYLARYRSAIFDRVAHGRLALIGVLGMLGAWVFWWRLGNAWIEHNETRRGIAWFSMNVLFFPILSIAIIPFVAWGSRQAEVPWGFKTLVYRTSLYSYSMYLAHTLVYYFAYPLLAAATASIFGQFRGLTFILFGLILIVLYGFSGIVFHVWEAPLTRLRERFAPSQHTGMLDGRAETMIPRA